jgi:hypothetical protein
MAGDVQGRKESTRLTEAASSHLVCESFPPGSQTIKGRFARDDDERARGFELSLTDDGEAALRPRWSSESRWPELSGR